MKIYLRYFIFILSIVFSIEGLSEDAEVSSLKSELFSNIHLTNESSIGRIYIGPKDSMISQSTFIYVKAACDHFIKTGASCVILELDTPGGEVFAAEKISDILKAMDMDYGIPVIAYINNWAISAGAMLAYSSRYIVTEADGAMGAATPVMMTEDGMKPTNEKMISALRADFANKASFFDRNPYIAEAMVDPDLILVERKGKIEVLSSEEDIQKPQDRVITLKGKLLTLTGNEMMTCRVADVVLPKKSKKDADSTSIKNSFLSHIPFFERYPDVSIDTFVMDYKTSIVAFLASPYMTSFLVFALMVSLYLEFSTPGITLPGLIAIISFFLLLVSSNAQQSITWFEPIVALFGVTLIVLETLFFPTMGFLIGIGILFIIAGICLMLIPSITEIAPVIVPSSKGVYSFGGEYGLYLLSMISSAVLISCIFIYILMRYDIRPKFLSRIHLILDSVSPVAPKNEELEKGIYILDLAQVVVTLRPAGKIERDGVFYDALSTGEFIDVGTQVRVVEIRGNMIFVEKENRT